MSAHVVMSATSAHKEASIRGPGADNRHQVMPGLDGVRGLAILMVMAVHFVGDVVPQDKIERFAARIANYGVGGVDLFFVLSGFLITGILFDSAASRHYYRNFYARRTLRIFPLYYGVLFVLFVAAPHFPGYPSSLAESAKHQTWLWTYGTNFYLAFKGSWSALPYVSHFWSLAIEEHFYLVWPLAIRSLSRDNAMRLCVLAVFVSLGLRLVSLAFGMGPFVRYLLTPCRLDCLCAGGFLALAVRSESGRRRVMRMARSPWVWFAGALTFLPATWIMRPPVLQMFLEVRSTITALFFGVVVVLAAIGSKDALTGRFFRGKVLTSLGKYSYGLYVYHGIIAYWLLEHGFVERLAATCRGHHTLAIVGYATFGAGVSLSVAMVSYHAFEKPFLRLKSFFEG